MAAVAQLKAMLGMDSSQYKAGVKDAENQTVKFQQRISAVGKAIGAAFSVAAVIQLTRTMGGLIKSFALAAARMESLRTEFVALGVAAGTAKTHMEDLRKFATTTPFQLEGIAQASQQLLALSEGVLGGVDSMRLFGDVAASTGNTDIAGFSFWVGRLYASLASGQPFLESANALLRLKGIAPSTIKTMRDMGEVGRSGSDIWDVYLKSIERFEGGMDRLSKTTEGRLSTLKDTMFELKVAFGETFEEEAKLVVSGTTKVIPHLKNLIPQWLQLLQAVKDYKNGVKSAAGLPGGTTMPEGTGELPAATGGTPEQKAVDRAKAANDKMRRDRLKGLEKMTADLVAEYAKVEDAIKKAQEKQNEDLVATLRDRQQILKDNYAADVKAFKDAEEEKAAAARQTLRKAQADLKKQEAALVQGFNEETAALLESLKPQADVFTSPVNRGGNAAQGGFSGTFRGGLETSDRKLKLAIEANKISKQIEKNMKDMAREVHEVVVNTESGV